MNTLRSGFNTFKGLLRVNYVLMCCVLTGTMIAPSLADVQTMPDGQANVTGQFGGFDLDVHGMANTDDQRIGARLIWSNFSENIVVFLNTHNSDSSVEGVALGEPVNVSGRANGGGIYITGLPQWRNFTVNLRLSGETEKLDVDSNIAVGGVQAQTTFRNRSVSVALLVSPVVPVFDNGANVYTTIGASYHRSRRNVSLDEQDERALYRYEREYVPQLAIGLVYPFKRISLYTSLQYEQEVALGLGVRFHVTQHSPR